MAWREDVSASLARIEGKLTQQSQALEEIESRMEDLSSEHAEILTALGKPPAYVPDPALVGQFDEMDFQWWPFWKRVASGLERPREKLNTDVYTLGYGIDLYLDMYEVTGRDLYLASATALATDARERFPWVKPGGSRDLLEESHFLFACGRLPDPDHRWVWTEVLPHWLDRSAWAHGSMVWFIDGPFNEPSPIIGFWQDHGTHLLRYLLESEQHIPGARLAFAADLKTAFRRKMDYGTDAFNDALSGPLVPDRGRCPDPWFGGYANPGGVKDADHWQREASVIWRHFPEYVNATRETWKQNVFAGAVGDFPVQVAPLHSFIDGHDAEGRDTRIHEGWALYDTEVAREVLAHADELSEMPYKLHRGWRKMDLIAKILLAEKRDAS